MVLSEVHSMDKQPKTFVGFASIESYTRSAKTCAALADDKPATVIDRKVKRREKDSVDCGCPGWTWKTPEGGQRPMREILQHWCKVHPDHITTDFPHCSRCKRVNIQKSNVQSHVNIVNRLREEMGEGHQATKGGKLPAEPELTNEPQDNLCIGVDFKQVAPYMSVLYPSRPSSPIPSFSFESRADGAPTDSLVQVVQTRNSESVVPICNDEKRPGHEAPECSAHSQVVATNLGNVVQSSRSDVFGNGSQIAPPHTLATPPPLSTHAHTPILHLDPLIQPFSVQPAAGPQTTSIADSLTDAEIQQLSQNMNTQNVGHLMMQHPNQPAPYLPSFPSHQSLHSDEGTFTDVWNSQMQPQGTSMGNLGTWRASMTLTSMGHGNPAGSQPFMSSQIGWAYSPPDDPGTDNLMNWSPTQLQQHQHQQLSRNVRQSQTNNATISQQWTTQAENMGQGAMGMNDPPPSVIGLLIDFQTSFNQDHPSTYGMSPTGGVQGVFGYSDGMNEVDLAMTDGIRNGTNETARSSYRMDWSVDLETCTASDSLQQMVVESSSMHNRMADQTVA